MVRLRLIWLEVRSVLADIVREGDIRAHLRALIVTLLGEVTPQSLSGWPVEQAE
jgi:hypothetical protein